MSAGPVSVPAGYVVGRWKIEELIGAGAWGSVYAARAVTGPPAHAALKFLPCATLTPGQRALLDEIVERETHFGQRADHPHLIRVLESHTLRDDGNPQLDGSVVLVMERADGNVKQLLSTAPIGAPLPGHAELLEGVCSALVYMHARGWVHGDLTPGNVLLMPGGAVRVADFGVTGQVDGTHAYTPRIGSSDYLPPEWWTERVGQDGIALRTTADIWAFGVLAHQTLTGGLYPFPGTAPQSRAMAAQAYANGSAPLQLDQRLPEPWRGLIADCLAPDHAARSRHDAATLLARIRKLPHARHRAHRPAMRAAALITAAVTLAIGGSATTSPASQQQQSNAAGTLRPDVGIPAPYRAAATNAARLCAAQTVNPALIAAILKVESDFDPDFADPATASYGIAGWTPSVFRSWVGRPGDNYMNPVDAADAVARYLCWLQEGFTGAALSGDPNELLAAGYDTSRKSVIEDHGVPPKSRAFATAVARYAELYGYRS